ncbi:hypothetical protein HK405_009066 [Cladochytrium tenue]|nr:hypothetical protein HK405_009066 [Cladochytrium tenue]
MEPYQVTVTSSTGAVDDATVAEAVAAARIAAAAAAGDLDDSASSTTTTTTTTTSAGDGATTKTTTTKTTKTTYVEQPVAGNGGVARRTVHIVVNERTPLVRPESAGDGPSTLVDHVDRFPHLPRAVAGVPVDPEELNKLRHGNLIWKISCWILLAILHVIPPVFLLHFRKHWDEVPPTILFGASREWCRFFLLAAPWVALALALLGWRYFKPPADKEQPAALPLTPWQWVELREGKADPKVTAAAVWWAEHPASLRQYAEFSVVSWLLWSVLACAAAELLLICGFEFPFYGIAAWPWAMIPFSLLACSSYVSVITQFFVERGLKANPVEERGSAEGILIPGLDIRAVLQAERKRFDPLGSFPEPWAYFAGEILIFLLLL